MESECVNLSELNELPKSRMFTLGAFEKSTFNRFDAIVEFSFTEVNTLIVWPTARLVRGCNAFKPRPIKHLCDS